MATVYYRKPPKVTEVPATGHVVIEASAGTGKTFTLEHLVVDLLLSTGVDVAEILVVTFTDAATRELRERIRKLLRRLCDETGNTALPPGPDVEARYWIIDDDARRRLREALFRFDGATIATIHGFCQRVLTEHAFAGGRLFEQAHVDGAESFGIAFREVLREALADEGPVQAALEARLSVDPDLTDLEKMLYTCHRARCEVTPVWDPEGLAAAIDAIPPVGDLQARAKALLQGQGNAPGQIARFLGDLASKVLSTTDEALGRPDFVRAFLAWGTQKRKVEGMEAPCLHHLLSYLTPFRADEPAMGQLLDAVAAIEERAAGPEVMLLHTLLPRVRERLDDRKRSLGQIDYDDMLLGVHEALGAGHGDELVRILRRRWRFALVDEFQDTDTVQWQIFERLFVDGARENRLFIIGDPKQAIYGFRGADVHAYLKAKAVLLAAPGTEPVSLDQNFRSSAPLIDGVNGILASGFFTGEIGYERPVVCGKPKLVAKDATEDDAPVHLVHLFGEGAPLGAPAVRRGLACFIAEEIDRLVDPKRGLAIVSEDGTRPLRHEDIYILTRTGWEGRAIGDVLRRFGVPHAFFKQDGLYRTPEADHVCRLLRAVEAPEDRSARLKAWLTPFFEVPLESLGAWRDVSEHHPLVERLLRWKQMAEDLQWARLFDDILRRSGIVRRLVFGRSSERALTNYLHLFEALLAETHRRPTPLPDLISELQARIDGRSDAATEGDVQRLETERSAVQILTMHKAKGLQAKVVFVAGGFGDGRRGGEKTAVYHDATGERRLHVGKPPAGIAARIAAEVQHENERLLYVALTRAEVRMYLPYLGGPLPETPADGDRDYGWPKVKGCYAHLATRLEARVAEDRTGLAIRPVSCARRAPEASDDASIARWSPEPRLLAPLTGTASRAKALEAGHRGVLLTSYTRMSRDRAWQPPVGDFLDERAEASAGDDAAGGGAPPEGGVSAFEGGGAGSEGGGAGSEGVVSAATFREGRETAPEVRARGAADLPGGREVGIFLHELLEETRPADVRGVDALDWAAQDGVQRRASEAARRSGIAQRHVDAALSLVYRALTVPIVARAREGGDHRLEMPGGLASGLRHVPEMAFAFPIPEASHPRLGADPAPGRPGGVSWKGPGGRPGDDPGEATCDRGGVSGDRPPFAVGRGYVQGLVDLVFEHRERTYLLDWKSDRLPSFEPAAIEAHVAKNYMLQAEVYALAVVRLLALGTREDYDRAFGGIVYAFVRGMDGEGGLWFSRPDWDEVCRWEQALLERRQWGGEVIASEEAGHGP